MTQLLWGDSQCLNEEAQWPGLWSRGLDHTLQKGPPSQGVTSRTVASPRFYHLRIAFSYPPVCCHLTKPSAICPQSCRLRVVWSQKSQGNEMPMPVQPTYFLSLPITINPTRPQALCHWPGLTLPQLVFRDVEDSFSSRDTAATEWGSTHHSQEETQDTGDQTCSLSFDLRCLKDRHLNPY